MEPSSSSISMLPVENRGLPFMFRWFTGLADSNSLASRGPETLGLYRKRSDTEGLCFLGESVRCAFDRVVCSGPLVGRAQS